MKIPIHLKSLHYFLVAGQSKNFKQAAEELNVTQAAISQQIRILEEHLQVKLFERSNKQTLLTESGKQLMPFMQRGFDELKSGLNSISGDQHPQLLRISTVHSFASIWLIPRLQEFQKLHPEILIQITPGSELVQFNNSNIDLAIRIGTDGKNNQEIQKKILDDTLTFVASPKLLEGINIKEPEQVFTLPLLEDTTPKVVKVFNEYCNAININAETLTPILKTTDSLSLINSAIQGNGFLLANTCLVSEYINSGHLVQLLTEPLKSPYSLCLVAPKQNFSWCKVKLFEDWIVPKLLHSFKSECS